MGDSGVPISRGGPACVFGAWEPADDLAPPEPAAVTANTPVPPRLSVPIPIAQKLWTPPVFGPGIPSHPLSFESLCLWLCDLPFHTADQIDPLINKVVRAGKMGALLLALEQEYYGVDPKKVEDAATALTALKEHYTAYRSEWDWFGTSFLPQEIPNELEGASQFLTASGFETDARNNLLSTALLSKKGNSLLLTVLSYLLAIPYAPSLVSRPEMGAEFLFSHFPRLPNDWWQLLAEDQALGFARVLYTRAPERGDFRYKFLELLLTAADDALHADDDQKSAQNLFAEAQALYPEDMIHTLHPADREAVVLTMAEGALNLGQDQAIVQKYFNMASGLDSFQDARKIMQGELYLRAPDPADRREYNRLFDTVLFSVSGMGDYEGQCQHAIARAYYNQRARALSHRLRKAREHLGAALKHCPNDLGIIKTSARVHFASAQFLDCVTQCERGLQLFPKSRVLAAWKNKAQTQLRLGSAGSVFSALRP